MRNALAAVLVAGLLAACGGDGDDGDVVGDGDGDTAVTIHCHFADDFCDAVTGVLSSSLQSTLSGGCTGAGGSYGSGGCPTAGAVAGHCHYTGAAAASVVGTDLNGAVVDEHYYAPEWTSGDAQAYCGLEPAGTWVP